MRRCHQAILVVLAIGAISTLTACSADDQVPAVELADHVATTIEQRVGVRVDVEVDPAEQMKQHDEGIDS